MVSTDIPFFSRSAVKKEGKKRGGEEIFRYLLVIVWRKNQPSYQKGGKKEEKTQTRQAKISKTEGKDPLVAPIAPLSRPDAKKKKRKGGKKGEKEKALADALPGRKGEKEESVCPVFPSRKAPGDEKEKGGKERRRRSRAI